MTGINCTAGSETFLSRQEAMMKKLIPVLIFLILVLLSASCAGNRQMNYLSHQTYPLEVRGVLEYDGHRYTADINIPRAGDITVSVIEPEVIAGTVFSLSGGAVSISYGDIRAEITDSYPATDGILLARYMFSLTGDCFLGASVVSEDGVKYSRADYRTDAGNVSVFVQSGSEAPTKLTGELNGHVFSFIFMNEP